MEGDVVDSNVVEILPTPTEIMPSSLTDYAIFRSIPPLTMKPVKVRITGGWGLGIFSEGQLGGNTA